MTEPKGDNDAPPPGWQILLIGGHSGIGKSWLASGLAQRYGAEWRQVDNVRHVLLQAITPEASPELHTFQSPDVWKLPAETLAERLADIARLVSPALEAIVAQHLRSGARLVLEGDGILPEFAAHSAFGGTPAPAGRVRAIFLVEPDEHAVLGAMLARRFDIGHLPADEQRTQARASWLFGQRLRRDAEEYGFPVIAAQPWDTLSERVIATLEASSASPSGEPAEAAEADPDLHTVSVGDQSLLVSASSVAEFREALGAEDRPAAAAVVLDRLLTDGITFIDCGAWLGAWTLYAAAKGATVTAIEGDPVALEGLRANLGLNPTFAERVTIVDAALTDRDGPLTLYSDRFGNGASSLFDLVERDGELVPIRHHCTTQGIDAGRLFARAGWLDDPDALIAMDIEGAEYRVLDALGPAIETAACSFFIAFHPSHVLGEDEQADAVLRAHATLSWIDRFWEYTWWSAEGGSLTPLDKQHTHDLALTGQPLPPLLFSRRDDLPGPADRRPPSCWDAVARITSATPQPETASEPPAAATRDPFDPFTFTRPAASVAALMQRDFPIFIPTFNNPTYVRNMVEQLHQWGLTNIIVVDNASTSRKMRALLENDLGVTVIRQPANFGPAHIYLDETNYAALPDIFCVTDPDLELNPALPEAFLAHLVRLTERFQVGKAGFSLDISGSQPMLDDIVTFRGVQYTIREWEQQYWTDPVGELEGLGTVYRAHIDTTFALYNKKYFRPEAHYDAVRVAGVFTCRHLPWTLDTGIPPAEEALYRATTLFSQNLS